MSDKTLQIFPTRVRALVAACLSLIMYCSPAVGAKLYFNHYSIKNGLSQNTVSCMLQDNSGFIWAGTKDGLNRFDGISFRRVDVSEGESCSFVSALQEDEDGEIWVGANNGVFVYNPSTEKLERFTAKTADGSEIVSPVTQFLDDSHGNMIIIADSDAIYRYNKKSQILTKIKTSISTNVDCVAYDSNGRIWIGTFGGGLYYSDDDFKTQKQFVYGSGDAQTYIVSDIVARGDKIYVGTDRHGLFSIDIRNGSVMPLLSKDERGATPYVRKLLINGNHEIWIASESGIYIYDLADTKLLNHLTHNPFDKYSVSDNAFYSLMSDREGGIWAGSYFGGIDHLVNNGMTFDKYYPEESGNLVLGQRVREICSDPETGLVYVGSEDNGVACYHPSTDTFLSVDNVDCKNVHGLCIDGRKLWIGTFSQGLYVKDLSTGTVKKYNASDGLNSDYVFSIYRTLHGDILLGTMSGLLVYDRASDSFTSIPELNNLFVYNILEDSRGNLWVSTYSDGLFLRKGGKDTWVNFRHRNGFPQSLPSNKVYSVYEDRKGEIWVMTQDGLCSYESGKDTFTRGKHGTDRIQGMVYQMIEDNAGRFWLTTNHGLYCIDPNNDNLRHFSTADGLPTNQFNYNSSLKTPDGRLYFGTIEGLLAFNPMNFTVNTGNPPLSISEFYLHGSLVKPSEPNSSLDKSISMTHELHLNSNQNSIAFRIVSLRYSFSGEQRVKYKLEGFDKEWKYASLSDALLSYPNLDYGKYVLKVMSYNEFNGDESEMLELGINIATPVYLRWWAILAYIAIGAAIVFVIFHQYRSNSQLNNQRYIDKYTQEKEREAYDSKIKFFTNVAHEIRTPLTLIKAPLDCVSKLKSLSCDSDARENLDVIQLNVDRLLLLANQLLDFRKMEDGKFQIHKQNTDIKDIIDKVITRFLPTIENVGKHLDYQCTDKEVTAVVDSEAITKIISNLFTNAIKYGKEYVKVRLDSDDEEFMLTISNDGGIVAPEKRETIFSAFTRLDFQGNIPGTGLGLAYSRSLAQMHDGKLYMSDNSVENEFVLKIPMSLAPDKEEGKEKGVENLEQMIDRNGDAVTILIADDNVEMLSFLEKKLVSLNYRVVKAGNGQEALDVLANEYVDIVVSDIMMPGIDGIELVKRIKSDINFSHIPVILLTAKTRMEDKLAGLDSGADAYIEKPFTLEYLLANVSMLLRNRERMRKKLESMPLTKAVGKGLSKVDEEFLRKINDIIKDNFNNPDFSMEEVITAMGMSRTSFYRKIKGLLDLNPNEYIKIERLKHSARLFDEGHTGVSEVCYMVGFSSPGYFTKCFQKHFGMTPKEYIANKQSQRKKD